MRAKWILLGLWTIAITGGCSTAREADHRTWIDLFTPGTNRTLTADCADYGVDRLERDYRTLQSVTAELASLDAEMAVLRRILSYKAEPYLTEEDNEKVAFLLLRFAHAQDALWDIANYYVHCVSTDEVTHTKGGVLGMSAGLNLSYYRSRFAALFIKQKEIVRVINDEHPRYEIAAGSFDKISDHVTSMDHLEQASVAWHLFGKELANTNSMLALVCATDPAYAELLGVMDRLHADTHIQTKYVLHTSRHELPDYQNRLHHSRIAALGDAAGERMGKGLYSTRGLIFRDVARIKTPGAHLAEFSEQQVRQIKGLLKPGDVLLTFTAGYMSNVFLPGNFKHGITYIGSVEERRAAGLKDELLAERAVSDRQRKELLERVQRAKTADGYDVNVVEAVAEGVIMNSLDKLLATHINRLVVFRPNITDVERLDQLVGVLQYVGAAYDFKFDFTDDTYQCCTELVYRTTNRKGEIDFPLVHVKGLWILAADDILHYAVTTNPDAFEFVLLAEQSTKPDDYRAVIYTGSEGEQKLRELMTASN